MSNIFLLCSLAIHIVQLLQRNISSYLLLIENKRLFIVELPELFIYYGHNRFSDTGFAACGCLVSWVCSIIYFIRVLGFSAQSRVFSLLFPSTVVCSLRTLQSVTLKLMYFAVQGGGADQGQGVVLQGGAAMTVEVCGCGSAVLVGNWEATQCLGLWSPSVQTGKDPRVSVTLEEGVNVVKMS